MDQEKGSNSGNEYWQDRVQQFLFEGLPPSYEDRYAAITQLSHAFRNVAAKNLEGALNEYLKSFPQDTLIEKQRLATWVNEQLRLMGLAIRCPKTGLPGILKADFKDADNEDISRFRIEVRDERRGRFQSHSSNSLFELRLMEDIPRQESLSRGFRNRNQGKRTR